MALLGFAILFGVAVWLVFDWCWYPKAVESGRGPARMYLPGLRRLLVEAGVDERVSPSTLVWLCVGFGMLAGIVAFQSLQLLVLSLGAAIGVGVSPLLICSWLRAR